jgi:hypothetical protein
MAEGEPGSIQIPWYATFFRAEKFEEALAEIAPVALRYGAVDYDVYRNADDTYKFLQTATFERKLDFTAYWEGPEFIEFRSRYSSWYQVPVIYSWAWHVASGALAGRHPAPLAGD